MIQELKDLETSDGVRVIRKNSSINYFATRYFCILSWIAKPLLLGSCLIFYFIVFMYLFLHI